MWNVADDNEIKLAIKKIMKMKNRTNWIANNGNSTKIFMKGDDMELEKQAKPKKSLIDIMNRRFDSMDKRMDEKFVLIFKELKDLKKETNKIDSINKRLDSIEKELKNDIKNINEQTNSRFDLLENKLNNVIKLNNLKV